MQDLKGGTAVLTGASRGIGPHIARALAKEQMNLVLAARAVPELEEVARQLRQEGCRVLAVPTDITDQAALEALVEAALRSFGEIDVLVNNAGTYTLAAYHQLEWDKIDNLLRVNLTAPMLLTRIVLPGMLTRGKGHIVNISSLAGKVGLAYEEPYCAAKAGLISFTGALRAAYRGSGVSASVICPGFIKEVGMYRQMQNDTRVSTPLLIGTSSVHKVALAVVRAIKQNLPEVIINPSPVRPLLALQALFPRLSERVLPLLMGDIFKKAAQVSER